MYRSGGQLHNLNRNEMDLAQIEEVQLSKNPDEKRQDSFFISAPYT